MFAGSKRIGITAGMMRFAHRDNEVATVVGHEIRYNTPKYIDKQRGNLSMGLVVDLLAAGLGLNTGRVFSDIVGYPSARLFRQRRIMLFSV